MSNSHKSWLVALALCAAGAVVAQEAAPAGYPGIGRAATPKEVAAWDIDVRPDFKGLPAGSGSVAQGQDVWEAKCASCHGVFGEANNVFSPLVGGTTAEDVKTGHAARLKDPGFPGRTTLMKVATVSTLWDYIRRAMPWNAPKSLTPDEVYAVTAYLLNLGGVLPDNFVLSDKTMAEAQARLPNRKGMSTAHALWPGKSLPATTRRPDVLPVACMANCEVPTQVASLLPEHARNNHGNLAEQNRLVGPQRGADTTRPAGAPPAALAAAPATAGSAVSPASPKPAAGDNARVQALLQKNACVGCHAVDSPLVGPAFRAIAKKHAERADLASYLAGRIKSGGSGTWGPVPMPPQTLADDEARTIAQWLAAGAPK
ncbi:MAG: c-type cytochrome [Burkholderiales bacterium]|nr:c-type cytochrome [Burkholderiales bacterium]